MSEIEKGWNPRNYRPNEKVKIKTSSALRLEFGYAGMLSYSPYHNLEQFQLDNLRAILTQFGIDDIDDLIVEAEQSLQENQYREDKTLVVGDIIDKAIEKQS